MKAVKNPDRMLKKQQRITKRAQRRFERESKKKAKQGANNGSKGYFNPRMKLKDFNKKRNAFVQKPDSKRECTKSLTAIPKGVDNTA